MYFSSLCERSWSENPWFSILELRQPRDRFFVSKMTPVVQAAYLSLKQLASYSGLSVRTLRGYLTNTVRPLPHYRIGGRVLVKAAEYDEWARSFKVETSSVLREIVDDVLRDFR